MIEGVNGKLLVYASAFAFNGRRLRSVSTAVARVARLLNLDLRLLPSRAISNPYTFTTKTAKKSQSRFTVIGTEKLSPAAYSQR